MQKALSERMRGASWNLPILFAPSAACSTNASTAGPPPASNSSRHPNRGRRAPSPAHLSLQAPHRRGLGSLYAALDRGRASTTKPYGSPSPLSAR
jgi:hypothetical protein